MPFVVSTKRTGHDIAKAVSCGGTGVLRVCECGMQSDMGENGGDCPYAVSRVAVGTLEDVAKVAPKAFIYGGHVPESGGTVGPLPDGSLIEVEPTNWYHLNKAAGLSLDDTTGDGVGRYTRDDEQKILAAFNEANR